jgi:internalin A
MKRIVLPMLVLIMLVGCLIRGYSAEQKSEPVKPEEKTMQRPQQAENVPNLGTTSGAAANATFIAPAVAAAGKETKISSPDQVTYAIAEIEQHGWLVCWDENSQNGQTFSISRRYPSNITDADFLPLRGLKNIRCVDAAFLTLTDAGLANMVGLNQLEELNITRVKGITDNGLSYLRYLPNLQILNISDTKVGDNGILQLKGLTQLRALNLNGNNITPEIFAQLKDLNNLRVLTLGGEKVTDECMRHLKAIPNLEELNLENTKVTDEGLELLAELPSLRKLRFTRMDINIPALIYLGKIKGLRSLTFSWHPVNDDILYALEKCVNLQELCLYGTNTSGANKGNIPKSSQITGPSDAGLARLKSLTQLESLEIDDVTLTTSGLACLREMTNLKTLGIYYLPNHGEIQAQQKNPAGYRSQNNSVTDAAMEHLKGLTRMQNLALTNTAITDAGLDNLQAMKDLRSLDLSYTRITDAGLAKIKGLTNLRSLRLACTRITGEALGNIEGMTQLEDLDLMDTRIAKGALIHLQPLVNLRKLNLGGALITDDDLRQLLVLKKLKRLTIGTSPYEMDRGIENRSNPKITDAGLECLKDMTQLEHLSIRYYEDDNVMTRAGVQNLQKAMPHTEISNNWSFRR